MKFGGLGTTDSNAAIGESLLPAAANTYGLGSTTLEWLAVYIGQNANSGVYLGLGQEGRLWYDQTSNKHITLATSEELYFTTSKTMAAATDQSFLIDTALTLGANRTTGYGTCFGQTAVTLGGNTLDTSYTVYVGAAPTQGTAKYSLGVAGAATFGATLAVTNAITASGGIAMNDDSSLANTKNLLAYATAAEYITIDGDGFQGMAMLSDVAAPDITFLGFSAKADATSNKDGGSLIFQPGTDETGGTGADGTIQLNDADGTTVIGVDVGTITVPSGVDMVSAGAINFKVSGDSDDYLQMYTDTNRSVLRAVSSYLYCIGDSGGLIVTDSDFTPYTQITAAGVVTCVGSALQLGGGLQATLTSGSAADASTYYIRIAAGNSTGDNESAPIGLLGGQYGGTKFAPVIVASTLDTGVHKYAAAFTAQADPLLAVFSHQDPDSGTTKHVYIKHDDTDGVIGTGAGNLEIASATGNVVGLKSSFTFIKTGALSVGDDQTGWLVLRQAIVVEEAYAVIKTVPTGAALTMQIEKSSDDGATWSEVVAPANFQIAISARQGENTGLSVALAEDDVLRFNIDQVGSTVAGSDITVLLKYKLA